jgi:glycosylphosphatidylinositol transamidase (GPIT) subunit GPI8
MKRIVRFKELLVILDTCQAETFFTDLDTPGVTIYIGVIEDFREIGELGTRQSVGGSFI